MTGWGQSGPWAHAAGHDLKQPRDQRCLVNHRRSRKPNNSIEPDRRLQRWLNVPGRLGSSSMLYELMVSYRGQVVDVAILDGVALLAHAIWLFRHLGMWTERRQSNILDGVTPWYAIYRYADRGHMTVAAIENPFYAAFLDGLGLSSAEVSDRAGATQWHELRALFTERFASRTRDEWAQFGGTDACVARC
nr:CoA transferase [Mycobacterium terramassiliense]